MEARREGGREGSALRRVRIAKPAFSPRRFSRRTKKSIGKHEEKISNLCSYLHFIILIHFCSCPSLIRNSIFSLQHLRSGHAHSYVGGFVRAGIPTGYIVCRNEIERVSKSTHTTLETVFSKLHLKRPYKLSNKITPVGEGRASEIAVKILRWIS